MNVEIDENKLRSDIREFTKEVLKELICDKLEKLDIVDDLIISSAKNSIDELMKDEDVKCKLKEKLLEDLSSDYYFEQSDVIEIIKSNILHIMKFNMGLIDIENEMKK